MSRNTHQRELLGSSDFNKIIALELFFDIIILFNLDNKNRLDIRSLKISEVELMSKTE